MTARDGFDRDLGAWLTTSAGTAAPDYLDETLGAIDHLHQRPSWAFPGRWLPAGVTLPSIPVPVLVALLLIALLVGLGVVGGKLRLPRQVPTEFPPPYGLAKPGLLAFDSGDQVVVATPDGSGIRVLHPSGRPVKDSRQFGATFSRDGTRVAYWEVYGWRTGTPSGGPPAAHLWVVDVDGQNAINLTRDLQLAPMSGGPAGSWSPDGSSIAFSAVKDSPMYVVAADGRTPPRAIDTGFLAADTPVWSPDGSLIAFTGMERQSGGGFGSPRQYVIQPDGTGLVEVGTGSADRQAGMGQWSSDGRRLVFIRNQAPLDVQTGTIPTTTEIVVAERAAAGWLERIVVAPSTLAVHALSNDDTRIAFIRMRPDTLAGDLFVVGADGTGERMISDRAVNPSLPCWSPDDASIAVTTGPIPPGGESMGPTGWPDQAYTLFPVDGRGAVDIPAGTVSNPFACSWQRLAP